MSATRFAALRPTLFFFAALGLSVAHPQGAVAQQTFSLTFSAASQSSAAPTTYGNVTMQASTVSQTVTLTAGAPQTVSLGSLDAGYSASAFPNGTGVPFSFSFTRSFIVAVAGVSGAFTFTEPMVGSGFAERGGSVGQYTTYNFSVNSGSSSAGLGSLGTLQAQWQPGSAFNDGLSDTPAPLSAVLTFAAAPEPSQTAALALGSLGLGALAFCTRIRRPA